MSNLFWRRWTRQYLPNIQERQNWKRLKTNLKINDLVLLMDEKYPRGQWPLARVVEVVSSKDGLVRIVKIKTDSTAVTRAKRRRRREIKTTTTILTHVQ